MGETENCWATESRDVILVVALQVDADAFKEVLRATFRRFRRRFAHQLLDAQQQGAREFGQRGLFAVGDCNSSMASVMWGIGPFKGWLMENLLAVNSGLPGLRAETTLMPNWRRPKRMDITSTRAAK